MPSLRDLLAAHAPLLLFDAASARVQVGWFETPAIAMAQWQSSEDEAGVAVFQCIENLGVDVRQASAFAFCDGPGSILGIRTVAMALRTWCVLRPRPVFAYTSLALVAHALARDDVGVIADARRDSWHRFQRNGGLQRVPTGALSGDLVTPEGFRNWTPLPATVQRVGYAVPDLLARTSEVDLFLETGAPDAFLHEEPSYVTWTPQIHRAPGERS